jgi:hypothetical protein
MICVIGFETFFKPYVLKPNLKFLTPKKFQGSTIDDNLIAVKMIVVTFLDFLDPDKARWASTIDNFFTSFVNIYLSCISTMLKGIDCLSKLCVNYLHKPKPPSTDVVEDRRSTTIVFVCFLYLLEFFLTTNLSALGVVFSCRFVIQVLKYFRHEASQVQTNPTR